MSVGPPRSVVAALAMMIVAVMAMLIAPSRATLLPEDRADAMYHRYDGGGVEVQGPALLVRKDFRDTVSLSGIYYQDSISAASPDIFIAGASPYTETRHEIGGTVTYLHDISLMNLAYSYSTESDYTANTLSGGLSFDLLSGLSTVDLGFERGWDQVRENGNPLFDETADHFRYRVGLTQVLTARAVLNLTYEGIADSGFLNNPYRKALLRGVPVDERYPGTRTSSAIALRARKYFEPRSSVFLGYRYYTDTWNINGHTVDAGYSRYFGPRWVADIYYRYYTQDGASFYSNNFQQEQNFMARDKELSTFSSNSVGVNVGYTLFSNYRRLDDGTLSVAFEYMFFNYDDYTAQNPVLVPGAPDYSFSPYTLQLNFAVRY